MKRAAAEIVREHGPYPDADNIGGVTYDGQQVWMATGQGSQTEPCRQIGIKDVGHAVTHGHDAIEPTGQAGRLITPEHHGFSVGQVVTDTAPGEGRFAGYVQPRHLLRQEGQAGVPLDGVAGKPVGSAAQAQQPA